MDTTVAGDTLPATTANQPLGPGTTIDRYRIERRIGAGGMGVVFLAFDPELERNVALKLLRDCRDDDADRLRREARALAALSHPNVVAVHDVGEHEGQLFLAMEYVDGGSLRDWIAKPRPWRDVVRAVIAAGRGIEAAHAAGLVHRDIKPDNLLVGRDGRVRVTDFGIVASANRTRDDDLQLTVPGALIGTPAYMPPEQLAGKADARSDQFSLCATAFEGLFGTRPFAGATIAAITSAIVQGEIVETHRDVPRWLRAAIVRGLAPEPAQRWPSIGALCDELERRQHRSRRWLIAGGIATAALAGSAAAWLAVPASPASLPPCDSTIPDATWSSTRAAKLRSLLGDARATHVEAWLQRWSATADDVCLTAPREPVIAAARRKCLDDQLAAFGRQATRWERGEHLETTTADISIMMLPLPWRCSRTVLENAPEPPTPVQTALGEAARRVQLIHQAQQFRSLDPDDRATRAIAQQARDIHYPPLTSEILLALANEHLTSHRDNAAAPLLYEAIELARSSHDLAAELDATVALANALRPGDPQQALDAAESGRALIRRLGGAPDVDAKLDGFVASAWETLGRSGDAAAAYRHGFEKCREAYGPESWCEWNLAIASLHTLEVTGAAKEELEALRAMVGRAFGLRITGAGMGDPQQNIPVVTQHLDLLTTHYPDSLEVSDAEMTLAAMHVLADQNEQAVEQYGKAIEVRDKLGIRDPQLVFALAQSAWLLLELARPTDALPLANRAVAVGRATSEGELAGALAILGRVLIATGSPAAARSPLRESLALAEKLHLDARRRARTRYFLAQALWAGTPSDRRTARDLARAARIDFRTFLDNPGDIPPPNVRRTWDAQLAEMERWLREHQ